MNCFLNFRFIGAQSSRTLAPVVFLLLVAGVFTFCALTGCEKDNVTGSQRIGGSPESGTLMTSCDDPFVYSALIYTTYSDGNYTTHSRGNYTTQAAG